MNNLTSRSISILGALAFLPLSVAQGAPSAADENTVFYSGLREKGLRKAEVLAKGSKFKPVRERPAVRYLTEKELPHAKRKGDVAKESVAIRIVERAGGDQEQELVSFGLPLRKGALYSLSQIRMIDAVSGEEKALPLQANALALWPDGSLKSVLLQFHTNLKAGQEKELSVEFGHEVARQNAAAGVKIRKERERWLINTGAIEVALAPAAFAPPGVVRSASGKRPVIAQGEGITIVGADETIFSSAAAPLDSLKVEREGALEMVLRAEGAFHSKDGAKLMRHVTRLRFISGSAKVEVVATLINDALEREFTDIRSLSLEVGIPGVGEKGATSVVLTGDEEISSTGDLSLTQWDENTQEVRRGDSAGEISEHRSSGGMSLGGKNATVQLAFKDFWQRWPKGIELKPGHLKIGLLPRQAKALEKGLPVHLQFPFVEEHYRTKWGTAFTERMVFDFAAGKEAKIKNFSAGYQTPPQVVLPRAYVAATGVFVSLPAQDGERLQRWNSYVNGAMQNFLQHREEARQYGYLNWGDWYGERGRNWGNNEYDIPHGFFMQYLITGDGRYFDAGLAGVRHQADVDIIHAYPDPFYIGANLQHSIGHSGISYQKVTPKTWSHRYDYASAAMNGHTWADGMADCWLLTGDPVVMESLLALGEHIRWAAVPQFKEMGNHHRSAGWSSVAAAATYRATSDPEYLEGLRKIIALPLAQWDSKTGIWPYPLPLGHTGGREGLIGSSIYNLGILLTGISRYHEFTGDPRAVTVMDGAAAWLLKSWSEERAWPYAALADGSLFRKPLSANLNPLIYPPLAYIGKVTGNPEVRRTAEKAFDVSFAVPVDEKLPKEFSIKMYATPWALAMMEDAAAPDFADVTKSTESTETIESAEPKD